MDAMFVHEHGVGAALRAVQQQAGAGYFASLQSEWERVLLECTDQNGYDQFVSTLELTVEGKVDVASGLLIIKTLDVVCGATACELARLTQDVQCRVDWEKQMRYCPDKSLELLEVISEQESVVRLVYPGMLFVPAREFIDRRVVYRHDAAQLHVCLCGDANYQVEPSSSACVRAQTIFQGVLVSLEPFYTNAITNKQDTPSD
jgi:hypothetical protein